MTSGLDFASDSALFEPAANILCMHLVSRLLNTEAFMDTLIQYVGPRVT